MRIIHDRTLHGVLAAGIFLLPWVSVTPAAAQEGAGTRDEILVTARKKEENLQTVPISISAFTAEDIENRGIQSLEDLARQTPSLEFASVTKSMFRRSSTVSTRRDSAARHPFFSTRSSVSK
jgi:outer membrane receptor protein involved in Fe transport